MIFTMGTFLKREQFSMPLLRKLLPPVTRSFPLSSPTHYSPGRSILTDEEIYPDGKLFNPARWLEPSYPTYKEPLSLYPNCHGFQAFGYGRRACPGVEFAERSLVIMIAKLGWAVNIRWPLGQDGKEIRETLVYEPVPAPRPMKFGCRIEARDPERVKIVEKATKELNMG